MEIIYYEDKKGCKSDIIESKAKIFSLPSYYRTKRVYI